MKYPWLILLAVLALFHVGIALAVEPGYKTTTRAGDSLLKELESRTKLLAAAARKGDIDKVRALRPAAVNKMMGPNVNSADLKDLAAFIAPDITDFRFVQLDSSGRYARAVYYKTSKDQMTIMVQMFIKEGDWKVGGNNTHNYHGRLPTLSTAIAEALKNPNVRLPKQ